MTSFSSSAGRWRLPRLRIGVGRPEGTKARLRPSINPTQVLIPQEVDPIAIFRKVFRKKIESSGGAVFGNPLAGELQHHRDAGLADDTPLDGQLGKDLIDGGRHFRQQAVIKVVKQHKTARGWSKCGLPWVNDAAIPTPTGCETGRPVWSHDTTSLSSGARQRNPRATLSRITLGCCAEPVGAWRFATGKFAAHIRGNGCSL